jgi:hypothetical protein
MNDGWEYWERSNSKQQSANDIFNVQLPAVQNLSQ